MDTAVFLINTSAVLCVIFGLYILTRDYKKRLYQIFMLLCVLISALALITGKIFTITLREELFLWDRIYALLAFICWAVNLHFYIILTGKKIKTQFTVLLYLPAAILTALEFTGFPLVTDFARQGSRWKYIYSGTYYLYMLYSISYAAADMVLLYKWSTTSCFKKHRLQGRVILASTIILWVICITTDYILSHFAFYAFPPVGAIGRIVYACIIWYSFFRFRFLDTGLAAMLDEIIQNSGEIVVLLNPDYTVRKHSRMFRTFLKPGREKITGNSILNFFPENSQICSDLDKMTAGSITELTSRLLFKTGAGRITADCHFKAIKDKFGDIEFILMNCRENRDAVKFNEIYNLSGRQMEIISLALQGLTNTEISYKLNISKKTTEVHFFNIYNKLGINSKIELYNLGIEYNLLLKKPLPVETE